MNIFWGQSMESYDSALKQAVNAARTALPGMILEWFEVHEFRGGFKDNEPQFQTAIRVGYRKG